jgi:rare lipoprotein A
MKGDRMGVNAVEQRHVDLQISNKVTRTVLQKDQDQFPALLKSRLENPDEGTVPEKQKPIEYTVQPGDNLWKIGVKMFKTDPGRIARDNRLANPDLIRPGQKLVIYPGETSKPEKEKVTASWYGADHQNKITAGGRPFDMNKDMVAHKTLPLGTKIRMINPENGRTAVGRVEDRGPFIKGRDLDVSLALAKKLGFVQKGVTQLMIEVIT